MSEPDAPTIHAEDVDARLAAAADALRSLEALQDSYASCQRALDESDAALARVTQTSHAVSCCRSWRLVRCRRSGGLAGATSSRPTWTARA